MTCHPGCTYAPPGGLYSCPDFFSVPETDLKVFASLDQRYFIGRYAMNASRGAPTFVGIEPPTSQLTSGEIWKTAGEGPNNALNRCTSTPQQ